MLRGGRRGPDANGLAAAIIDNFCEPGLDTTACIHVRCLGRCNTIWTIRLLDYDIIEFVIDRQAYLINISDKTNVAH